MTTHLHEQATYFAENEHPMRGFYNAQLISCAYNVIQSCISGTDHTGAVYLRTPPSETHKYTNAFARTIKVGLEIIGGLNSSERFANSDILTDINLQAVKPAKNEYFSLADFFSTPAASDQVEFRISREEIEKAVERQSGIENVIVDLIKSVSFQTKPLETVQRNTATPHHNLDIVLE